MTTRIEPLRSRLLELKVLVPLVVLFWLAVSLPLLLLISHAQAETVSDPSCAGPGEDPTAGVWGQPGHITVIDPCFHVSGNLVYGQWWRGDTRDGDLNHYMKLDSQYAGVVTSSDQQNLRMYQQAQGAADILGEIIPQDQGAVPAPCLDSDLGGSNSTASNPCNGEWVEFVGPYVYDNNHGYKEIHPVVKWSNGSTTCSRAQPCNGGSNQTGQTTTPTPPEGISSETATSSSLPSDWWNLPLDWWGRLLSYLNGSGVASNR